MRRIMLTTLVVIAFGCSKTTKPGDRVLTIEPLSLPVTGESSEPQLTVSGDRAIASWVEQGDSRATLKFAERTATGWSEPRTVASGTDWFLSWADVPSVVKLDDGTIAAQWLKNTDPAKEAYDLLISFSKDDGRTWTAPVTPHSDGTATQHGFASLFQVPGAGLGVVWLDGRAMQLEAEKDNDNMAIRAATFDRSGKELSETAVDDRVCECCPTSVALTSEGPIAAFRDRSSDEVRDIAVSSFVNGRWSPSTTVHADGWNVPACPINGPAIAARGRDVAVAWFTAKDDQGRAFIAFSDNAGATFGQPIRLDDAGSLGRVGAVLLDDGSAVASWVEYADKRAQLRVRTVDRSGARSAPQTVSGTGADRASGFPRLARRGQEALVAWTETNNGRSTVRSAAAKLTR